jgi:hypothetical protein
MSSSDSSDNTTYNTAKDYIASLNGNDTGLNMMKAQTLLK